MHIESCIQKEFLTVKNESHSIEFEWPLIPGLPDDVAKHCLELIPRMHFQSLGSICNSWRKFLQSREFSTVRRHAGTMEELLYVLTAGKGFHQQVLNPMCGQWQNLPPMPGPAKTAQLLPCREGVASRERLSCGERQATRGGAVRGRDTQRKGAVKRERYRIVEGAQPYGCMVVRAYSWKGRSLHTHAEEEKGRQASKLGKGAAQE